MSFMVFQLLFAVLALGLLVVAGLIVRQIVRKRPSAQAAIELAPPSEAEPRAPKLRMPSLRKQAAEPDPEPEAPLPVRRRQLNSFAEAERSAAEADAVVLPVPVCEPDITEPTSNGPDLPAEPETAFETAPKPAGESAPEVEATTEQALDYGEAVLGRLEEAFEDLQDEEISLGTYRERVLAEQAAVERRIAALQPGGDSADLDAALVARESVRWCLDWAEEQVGVQQG